MTEETKTKTPNQALMDSIDKCVQVLVIGLNKDGEIYMETSRPTYEFVNYICNRGLHTINTLENNVVSATLQAKRIEAENKVSETVQQDIAEQVEVVRKRGRPKKEVL
jgi:hypothetical protein